MRISSGFPEKLSNCPRPAGGGVNSIFAVFATFCSIPFPRGLPFEDDELAHGEVDEKGGKDIGGKGVGRAHPETLDQESHERRADDQAHSRHEIEEADFNQTKAADVLGTTRRILKYKMDKLGIGETKENGN